MLVGPENSLAELVECVDMARSHVHAPAPPIIFLCGGDPDLGRTPIPSLRAAFLHVYGSTRMAKHNIIIAEDAIELYKLSKIYSDVLRFEADFAEIAALVIIFCESPGSIAELGSFVVSGQIASKLLLIIDDKHSSESNFIMLGPVQRLKDEHGPLSVMTLNTKYVNVVRIDKLASINLDNFKNAVEAAVDRRMAEVVPPRTFESNRNGHIATLILALLQHYGALTFNEIAMYLLALGINKTEQEVRGLILCGQLAGWVKLNEFNFEVYYTSAISSRTVSFEFKPDVNPPRRDRWLADIREFWREKDPFRFSCISSGSAVP